MLLTKQDDSHLRKRLYDLHSNKYDSHLPNRQTAVLDGAQVLRWVRILFPSKERKVDSTEGTV